MIMKCDDTFHVCIIDDTSFARLLSGWKVDMKLLSDPMKQYMRQLGICQLLYKYGGIYMDADLICLRDPIEIIQKLNKYDFVGFGCTGAKCSYGYGQPSNWLLASRPNSILMASVLKHLLNKIEKQDKFSYHDLGKMVIWEELNKLIKEDNYEYFHYPNIFDGSRDINGAWVSSDIVFSDKKVEYEDEKNMMFFVFYSSDMEADVKKMSEKELLSKDWVYTKFLKRALDLK